MKTIATIVAFSFALAFAPAAVAKGAAKGAKPTAAGHMPAPPAQPKPPTVKPVK